MSEKIGVFVFTKPCKILQYCPYGSLVENFPILPKARAKAIEMGWYCKLNPDGLGYLPCVKDDYAYIVRITA